MGKIFSKNKKKQRFTKIDPPNEPKSPNVYQPTVVAPTKVPIEKPDFIALFDYDKSTTEDISMKKNDLLIVKDNRFI